MPGLPTTDTVPSETTAPPFLADIPVVQVAFNGLAVYELTIPIEQPLAEATLAYSAPEGEADIVQFRTVPAGTSLIYFFLLGTQAYVYDAESDAYFWIDVPQEGAISVVVVEPESGALDSNAIDAQLSPDGAEPTESEIEQGMDAIPSDGEVAGAQEVADDQAVLPRESATVLPATESEPSPAEGLSLVALLASAMLQWLLG